MEPFLTIILYYYQQLAIDHYKVSFDDNHYFLVITNIASAFILPANANVIWILMTVTNLHQIFRFIVDLSAQLL